MSFQSEVKVDGVYGPIIGTCTKVGLDGNPSEVNSLGTTYERSISGLFVPKRENDVQDTSSNGEFSWTALAIYLFILYVLYSIISGH